MSTVTVDSERPLKRKAEDLYKSAEAYRKVKKAVHDADYEKPMKDTLSKLCDQHGLADIDKLVKGMLDELGKDYGYRYVDSLNETSVAECSVCYEYFKSSCGVLPCGHIFCSGCIDTMKKREKSKGRKVLDCPRCRKETTFTRIKTGLL